MRPSGKTDDWFTPIELFEEHQQHTLWNYALDPCGHPEAPVSNAIASVGGAYRTENGLAATWGEETDCDLLNRDLARVDRPAVWCNPPYSDIGPWVERACEAARNWVRVSLLLPAWCDRRWWQVHIEPFRDGKTDRNDLLRAQTTFLPGRVRFGFPGDETGRKSVSPTFGSVLVDIWRPQ